MKFFLWIVIAAIGLTSCSNQQMYNSVQTNQKNECDKLQLAQRQECLMHFNMPYDQYNSERQKLLSDESR